MRNHFYICFWIGAMGLGVSGCMSAPSSANGAESWNMSAPLVSVTQNSAPKRKLTSLGEVTTQYCTSEGNAMTRMGILNEASKKALALKPGATHLIDAKFKNKGMACVEVFGTAAK